MTQPAAEKSKIDRALILSGGGARGAYQVGVIKYLTEKGWVPDMVCGTSIGAINAVAYGAGMSADQIAELWYMYDRKVLRQYSIRGFFGSFLRRDFKPAADIRKIKALFEKHLDIAALRKSKTRIMITALNMKTGQIRFFTQKVIEMPHIMAACAIPMVFPWQHIDGVPHWDAGLMVNTPVKPALAFNAKQIVIVLHSPAGIFAVNEPKTKTEVFELSLEHFLIGSYMANIQDDSWTQTPDADMFETPLHGSPKMALSMNGTKLHVVAPPKMMGVSSLFTYSRKQAENLIAEGYMNARMQLRPLFT